MDYKGIIKDSIETSLKLKLFKNKKEAAYSHIFKSKLKKLSMNIIKKGIHNFNPERLKKTAKEAYPKENRPRGNKDLSSINYYKRIKNIPPIWILKKNKEYYLLDGAHRIVASYIKNNKYINAYIIN